ncbi:hypothetical protein ACW95P_00845 [Candidatus Mycoplasma pogonae]
MGDALNFAGIINPINQSIQLVNLNFEHPSYKNLDQTKNDISEALKKVNDLLVNQNLHEGNLDENLKSNIINILSEKVLKNENQKIIFKEKLNYFLQEKNNDLVDKKIEILKNLINDTNDVQLEQNLQEQLVNLINIKNINFAKKQEKLNDISLSSNEKKPKKAAKKIILKRTKNKNLLSRNFSSKSSHFNRSYSLNSYDQNVSLIKNFTGNSEDAEKYNENIKKLRKSVDIHKIQRSRDILKDYLRDVKIFNGINAGLTAVAWGLVATYTAAAFWTFGGTIPNAIAAGVQAGITTYFLNESFNMQYSLEETLSDLNKILDSEEIVIVEKLMGMSYNDFLNEIKKPNTPFHHLGKSEILTIVDLTTKFSAIRLLGTMTIEALIKKIIEKVGLNIGNDLLIKNNIAFSLSKFTDYIENKVFKNITSRITAFASKIAGKRAALLATSWASPIGAVLSIVETIVSVSSIINTLRYKKM